MPRLARDTINGIAQRFVIANDDRTKQDIVDTLGSHPVNHAEFIDQLNAITGGHGNITHSYAYAAYLDCVRWLGCCNVVVDNSDTGHGLCT